jgi:hypothetical protein
MWILNCFFSARKIQRITLQFYLIISIKQNFEKICFNNLQLDYFLVVLGIK